MNSADARRIIIQECNRLSPDMMPNLRKLAQFHMIEQLRTDPGARPSDWLSRARDCMLLEYQFRMADANLSDGKYLFGEVAMLLALEMEAELALGCAPGALLPGGPPLPDQMDAEAALERYLAEAGSGRQ